MSSLYAFCELFAFPIALYPCIEIVKSAFNSDYEDVE